MLAVPVLLDTRIPGLLFQDVFVGSGKRFRQLFDQAVNRLNEKRPQPGGGAGAGIPMRRAAGASINALGTLGSYEQRDRQLSRPLSLLSFLF